MAGRAGQPRRIDAEQGERRREALLGGHVEDEVGLRRNGQPGVAPDLVLELPRAPARVAERDEEPRRAVAPLK